MLGKVGHAALTLLSLLLLWQEAAAIEVPLDRKSLNRQKSVNTAQLQKNYLHENILIRIFFINSDTKTSQMFFFVFRSESHFTRDS